MAGEEDQIDTGDALELEVEAPEFEEGQDDETVIAFSDDEQEDEPPLVKKLRDQIRERDRKLAQYHNAPPIDDDPEPEVPVRKSPEDFDYIGEHWEEYDAAREKAIIAKTEWKHRQGERDRTRQAAQQEQTKRVEQQKNALGVADYDQRAATTRETLSDAQMAILINGADNPAQLIYALGRSSTRLTLLAGEDNLARFAVMLGKMEKEIKVMKKTAPAPESRVVGATAQLSTQTDKHLERLEREADKSGDRTEVQRYKRSLREKAAA